MTHFIKLVLILCISILYGFTPSLPIDNNAKPIEQTTKQEAGIYAVNITIAQELTSEGSFGRVSWSTGFTEEQKAQILEFIKVNCAQKLDANVEPIYKKNKKGQIVTSIGGSDGISGMPTNTFKNAILTNEKDLFIKVDIYLTNDGKPLLVEGKKSVIKPKVQAYIKVLDRNKTEVYSHKMTKNSLEGMISLSDKKEPLSPENCLIIIESTLKELTNG